MKRGSIIASNSTIRRVSNVDITGDGNTIADCTGVTIKGDNNTVKRCTDVSIVGKNNTMKNNNGSIAISGDDNSSAVVKNGGVAIAGATITDRDFMDMLAAKMTPRKKKVKK